MSSEGNTRQSILFILFFQNYSFEVIIKVLKCDISITEASSISSMSDENIHVVLFIVI